MNLRHFTEFKDIPGAKYFDIREFVPAKVWHLFGAECIHLLDFETILMAIRIREYFGRPMIINNWHTGGNLHLRAYRDIYNPIGAAKSVHKLSLAIDFNIEGLTVHYVNKEIEDHKEAFYDMGVRRVEATKYTPTWTHADRKATGLNVLYFFNP